MRQAVVTQLVSAEGSARHPGLPSHWQERKQHRQPPRALTWIQTRFPLWPSVTVLTHHCPAHLNLAVFVVSRMDLTHILHGAFLPPASLNSCWCDLSGACSQPTRPLPEVPGLHSAPHHSQNRPVSARGHRQHVLRPSALSLQRGDQIPDHGSPHSSSPDGLGRLCPHQAGSPAPHPCSLGFSGGWLLTLASEEASMGLSDCWGQAPAAPGAHPLGSPLRNCFCCLDLQTVLKPALGLRPRTEAASELLAGASRHQVSQCEGQPGWPRGPSILAPCLGGAHPPGPL